MFSLIKIFFFRQRAQSRPGTHPSPTASSDPSAKHESGPRRTQLGSGRNPQTKKTSRTSGCRSPLSHPGNIKQSAITWNRFLKTNDFFGPEWADFFHEHFSRKVKLFRNYLRSLLSFLSLPYPVLIPQTFSLGKTLCKKVVNRMSYNFIVSTVRLKLLIFL